MGGVTESTSHPDTYPIRAGGEDAALRSAMYALCSEAVGSPFQLKEGASLATTVAELVELEDALPFQVDLSDLALAELDKQLNDIQRCRRQYSGLFEVGDRGPPLAIRQSLAMDRDTGVKERLVRFYDFFDYAVTEAHAWASDHLAVELEFMHWLCLREAQLTDSDKRSSVQFAQRDFLTAHVVNWLPGLADKVAHMAPSGPYKQIFASVAALATADLAYREAGLPAEQGGN